MLFVSHDVGDTADFERVLVVEGGTIVEDGAPGELLANPASRYRSLVQSDRALHDDAWSRQRWRHQRIERGRLTETTT
jgi:ABC-type dipeptide/oligopeptide/nickel transport system ATPase component